MASWPQAIIVRPTTAARGDVHRPPKRQTQRSEGVRKTGGEAVLAAVWAGEFILREQDGGRVVRVQEIHHRAPVSAAPRG